MGSTQSSTKEEWLHPTAWTGRRACQALDMLSAKKEPFFLKVPWTAMQESTLISTWILGFGVFHSCPQKHVVQLKHPERTALKGPCTTQSSCWWALHRLFVPRVNVTTGPVANS